MPKGRRDENSLDVITTHRLMVMSDRDSRNVVLADGQLDALGALLTHWSEEDRHDDEEHTGRP